MFNYTNCPYCQSKVKEYQLDHHLQNCSQQELIIQEISLNCEIPCELCSEVLKGVILYDEHIANHFKNNSKIFQNSTLRPGNNTRLNQSILKSKLNQELSQQQSRIVGIRSLLQNTQPLNLSCMTSEEIYEYFTNEDQKLKRGFSQQEIKQIKEKHLNSNMSIQQNQICSICQNLISKDRLFLECAHGFCSECIYEWLEYKKECPVCKREINL